MASKAEHIEAKINYCYEQSCRAENEGDDLRALHWVYRMLAWKSMRTPDTVKRLEAEKLAKIKNKQGTA